MAISKAIMKKKRFFVASKILRLSFTFEFEWRIDFYLQIYGRLGTIE